MIRGLRPELREPARRRFEQLREEVREQRAAAETSQRIVRAG